MRTGLWSWVCSYCSWVIWGLIHLLISRVKRFSEGLGLAGCPCLPSEFCPQYLLLKRTQPRKTVMMKLVRSMGRIQVMCLLAVAEDFTAGGGPWLVMLQGE